MSRLRFIFGLIILLTFINVNSLNLQQNKDSISLPKYQPKIDTSFIQVRYFNTSKIEKYLSDEDFIYEKIKDEPGILDRFWDWISNGVKNFLRSFLDDIEPTVGILKIILEVIPYVILLLGLYFLVKYFINVSSSSIVSDYNDNLVALQKDQELLQREDLDKLLRESIQQENYRFATRFLYLISLKKLRQFKIIDWEQQKTNADYLQELGNKNFRSEFERITKLYDFVWYGKFEINEKDFTEAQNDFKNLNQKIA